MKTELEEAEKYAHNYFEMHSNHYKGLNEGFIAGAKWQAERMYSEKEVYDLLRQFPNKEELDLWFEQNKKNNMKKIQTAEELGNKLYQPIGMSCNKFAIKLAIEFAKLHVEAALKSASEKGEAFVQTNGEWNSVNVTASVNKESILNSYSLENIK